ncbi:hypothetical protein Hypma_010340 [Hypsizygus marmoreus]|uniref:Zona occludens toxin N-terminal domain-containing protein n=1 Tax=Hypsizygus marmoreus TaxID=39966 RepID=A0A369JLI0_HYPMA|nr:hypothetical protein Hypma_010340 [Hypsizygus marmoreus]
MDFKKDNTPMVNGDPTATGVFLESLGASEAEFSLLDHYGATGQTYIESHDLSTAPLFTRDAYTSAEYSTIASQYGLLGRVISTHFKSSVDTPADPRLYLNTNAPFSAVVCGVQGSGKSHSVSVMLENMLVPACPSTGSLEKTLSGLVLHFGEGGPSSLPNEAAWLSVASHPEVKAPTVHVYVSHASLKTMRAVYAPLGSRVTVEPLFFTESELDAEAFMSMMAVGSSDSAPLYVQIILTILRELGENFTYQAFMQKLEDQKRSFNPAQLSGLEQRMSLLTSFLNKKHDAGGQQQKSRFAAGQLTIIDLSDPFIDPASACGLFEIITRLFVRADVGTGKVLVVDEAHKYLATSRASSGLTKALLTLTRQQRHLSMRVIISTQEPTVVPPVLLDLCTVVVLHRFTSPSWWEHLIKHVSADFTGSDAFDKVVKLQTGQAIILAPSAIGMFDIATPGPHIDKKVLAQFGRRYLVVKTRKRVTKDGGASILVLDD